MGTHPIFESDFDCLTGFQKHKMEELRNLKTYLKGLRADLARTNKIRKEMATHLKEKPAETTKLLDHMQDWKTIQRRMDEWTKNALALSTSVEKEVQKLQQPQNKENEKADEKNEKETEAVVTTIEIKVEDKIVEAEKEEEKKVNG